MAIALENFATSKPGNEQTLPDCTIQNKKNGNAPAFFSGPALGKDAPRFVLGLLSFMEGNVKILAAPLDPNLGDLGGKVPLSYAIPLKWGQKPLNGKLTMPASFPRGLSQCIIFAEAT